MGRSCKSGGCHGRRGRKYYPRYYGGRSSFWPNLWSRFNWPRLRRDSEVQVNQVNQAIQHLQKSQEQIVQDNQKALQVLTSEMKSKVPQWVMPVGITLGILLFIAIIIIVVFLSKR